MIWVTGDIHGDPQRLSTAAFEEQEEFEDQNENFVIILGDFGLVWNYEKESKYEKWWLNWLEKKAIHDVIYLRKSRKLRQTGRVPCFRMEWWKSAFHSPSCDPFDARTSIQHPRQNILYFWRCCKS